MMKGWLKAQFVVKQVKKASSVLNNGVTLMCNYSFTTLAFTLINTLSASMAQMLLLKLKNGLTMDILWDKDKISSGMIWRGKQA